MTRDSGSYAQQGGEGSSYSTEAIRGTSGGTAISETCAVRLSLCLLLLRARPSYDRQLRIRLVTISLAGGATENERCEAAAADDAAGARRSPQ